jgi:hypothetical protein
MKAFILISILATATIANASTYVVLGRADPWLAHATIDNIGTYEPADTAPFSSPVLVTVTPGSTITWSATGQVGHPGDIAGPDGASWAYTSRSIGANNGINDLYAPICSLIGVWYQGGGGTAFYMGANGSAVVPSGVTELFLGTMDSYGWANNIGQFDVTIPDAGSTLGLLGIAFTMMGTLSRKIRK